MHGLVELFCYQLQGTRQKYPVWVCRCDAFATMAFTLPLDRRQPHLAHAGDSSWLPAVAQVDLSDCLGVKETLKLALAHNDYAIDLPTEISPTFTITKAAMVGRSIEEAFMDPEEEETAPSEPSIPAVATPPRRLQRTTTGNSFPKQSRVDPPQEEATEEWQYSAHGAGGEDSW